MARYYGSSKIGKRVFIPAPGRKFKRINIVAGQINEKPIAVRMYKIVWLPLYFPDKNKIEKLWANLKDWLRFNSKNYLTIQESIAAYFKSE